MITAPIDWLIEGDPWVEYRIRMDLLGQSEDDPCPYANLAMLKAISAMDAWRDSPSCHTGAESLLNLWEQSTTQHPYMFFMGTDFRKLKVPFVWYDLLHVLDVITRFSWLSEDNRLLEMATLVYSKADDQGRFTNESVWAAWHEWEFGQKKEPSRWLTLMAWRVMARIGPFSPVIRGAQFSHEQVELG